MPLPTGYYNPRLGIGAPPSAQPIYTQSGQLDEEALRNGGQAAPVLNSSTPINTQFTYTNGGHYAGTNVPISDQALRILQQQNGIATDRDVSGTGGVGQSLANAGKFELDHVGNILEGLTDPTRIFGIDPLTTKFGNAVFGTNNEPLVNQMGGATSQQIRDYEAKHGTNSAGAAQGLHNAAAGTTAVIAAGTLANGGLTGGQGGSSSALTTMTPQEQAAITSELTNVPSGSGVVGFGGAGTAGAPANIAADFAGTQLGAPANGLVLEGGAGTISGSGLTAGLTKYGNQLSSLLGNGSGGGGGATQIPAGMFGSQVRAPQPRQAPIAQRPILPGMQPLPQEVGRRPYKFKGTTIWL